MKAKVKNTSDAISTSNVIKAFASLLRDGQQGGAVSVRRIETAIEDMARAEGKDGVLFLHHVHAYIELMAGGAR